MLKKGKLEKSAMVGTCSGYTIPQVTAQGNKNMVTGQEMRRHMYLPSPEVSFTLVSEKEMETIQSTMPLFFSLKPTHKLL